jgi:peptidoglycan/xylan/chitin deacetylase (PgdA/CDA1 family)
LFDIHQAYSTHREAKQASMINQRISGSTFSLDPFGALMPTTRDHQPIRHYDAAMTETVRTFQKLWNAGAFRLLVGYSNETLKLDEHGRLGPKTLAALDMVAPPMGIYKADGYQFTRRSDEGTKRFISLSFDDGPHPTRTRRLLDLLAQRELTATFYVTGNAGDNPALIRRIVDEGHRLGNHTKSHPPFGKQASDQIRTELDAVQAMVNDALGRDYRIEWTRPPGGTRGYVRQRKVVNQGPSKGLSDIGQAHHADKVYKERGYRQMHWQIDSNDWPPGTKPESVVNTVMRHTRSQGGVILMHDVQQQTIDAMPMLLDRIEAHNRDDKRVYDLVITTGEELFNMKYPEEVADAAGHS